MLPDRDDAFDAWLRSDAVRDLLRGLWKGVETARAANEPAARDSARTALGDALGAFCVGIGATDQLRRQIVAHALEDAGLVEEFGGRSFEELTSTAMMATEGGRQMLRQMAARGVLTLFRLLGATFAQGVVGGLGAAGKGFDPFWAKEPKSGVKSDGGPLDLLRQEAVNRLGYTAGALGLRLTADLLARAVEHFRRQARRRGIDEAVKLETARDWAKKAHRGVFEAARREGAEDRRNGTVKRHLLLMKIGGT